MVVACGGDGHGSVPARVAVVSADEPCLLYHVFRSLASVAPEGSVPMLRPAPGRYTRNGKGPMGSLPVHSYSKTSRRLDPLGRLGEDVRDQSRWNLSRELLI